MSKILKQKFVPKSFLYVVQLLCIIVFFLFKIILNIEEYIRILQHDSDGFNRYEANQEIVSRIIENHLDKDQTQDFLPQIYLDAIGNILDNAGTDPRLTKKLLTLPSNDTILRRNLGTSIEILQKVTDGIRQQIAASLQEKLLKVLEETMTSGPPQFDNHHVGLRELKGACLSLLMDHANQDYSDLSMKVWQKNERKERITFMQQLFQPQSFLLCLIQI